jgi:hypothetical protein
MKIKYKGFVFESKWPLFESKWIAFYPDTRMSDGHLRIGSVCFYFNKDIEFHKDSINISINIYKV